MTHGAESPPVRPQPRWSARVRRVPPKPRGPLASDGVAGADWVAGTDGATPDAGSSLGGSGVSDPTGALRRPRGAARSRRRCRHRRSGRRGPVLGDPAPLDDGLGHDPAHERARADGVVVARDHVGDHVGVAVGVHHGHDRHHQLVGLGDGDVLLLGVDHEDRVGEPVEVADATEVAPQLLELATVTQAFLLGHGVEVAGPLHGLVLPHLPHPRRDGGEVGQHPTQPPLVDDTASRTLVRRWRWGPGSASWCRRRAGCPPWPPGRGRTHRPLRDPRASS